MFDHAGMAAFLDQWMAAWNQHDLEGVLRPMSDDVVFVHWNGRVTRGKRQLERVWQPWFAAHGDFQFAVENLCVDVVQQSFSFEWTLEWPSPEPSFVGQRELRDGIDIVEMRDGLVGAKRSYTRTVLKIANRLVPLKA